MRLTADEALSLSRELSAEIKSKKADPPYDASSYVWQSDDKVGNTLPEIEDIRAYGYPLSHGVSDSIGYIKFRGYQYEGEDGFLKGSRPWREQQPTDHEVADLYELLYLLPIEQQIETLVANGKQEFVHIRHGLGYLLDNAENLVRMYFLYLPGETPTVHRGANIKWVKRENLL